MLLLHININNQSYIKEGAKGDTVKPVYSGHPSGPKQLAVIERWLDYTM